MIKVGSEPALVLDCRNQLGESILWDDRTAMLRWADIHVGNVVSWQPDNIADPVTMAVGERVGAIALRDDGGLTLALASGFVSIDASGGRDGDLTLVEASLPTTRLNDGRVDPVGRFVCGGMDEASPQMPLSSVYAYDADRSVHPIIQGVHCTNSLCWSPDGATLYFTDMPSRMIEAFDYDVDTGEVANRRVFANLSNEPGLADGSIVDAEGFVWNAQWGGAKLVRYAPDGSVDREVAMPVSNPTCLAFGGPDLDILFVTTAWFGLTDKQRAAQPYAGSLFAFRPGVRGRLENRYAG